MSPGDGGGVGGSEGGGCRGSTALSVLPSGRQTRNTLLFLCGSWAQVHMGMFPDGGGSAGLLRHSGLCSANASPGSSLWPQPDLELLHLCKSKFKPLDFSSQPSLHPCSSTALLQLASAPHPICCLPTYQPFQPSPPA